MATTEIPSIMLVEDSLDDELLAQRGISKAKIPCKVVVTRDGAEALDTLLNRQNELPSLVVLDYRLPKFTGLQVLERLRAEERTSCLPVVIFSGTNSDSNLKQCYKTGANSCVRKPDHPADYIERLVTMTQYWLSVNRCSDAPPDAWVRRRPQGHTLANSSASELL